MKQLGREAQAPQPPKGGAEVATIKKAVDFEIFRLFYANSPFRGPGGSNILRPKLALHVGNYLFHILLLTSWANHQGVVGFYYDEIM